ncbi:MAG: ferredoxin:glutaredoxin reductase [Firmicutes bacterium]|nr:ferredoxin:glutaredoxin reductase [Bacillota bacterium]
MSDKVDKLYDRLKKEAESSGYHLNPDVEFTKMLLDGLVKNEERYSYLACPCRLAEGEKEVDQDIICPCDYRDGDLNEFNMCYCGLYVSGKYTKRGEEIHSIPDRRLLEPDKTDEKLDRRSLSQELPFPIYRCKVCGYLCAREAPPDTCPICHVSHERFEVFLA